MAITALAALALGLLAGASLFAEVSRRQNRALYRLNARLSRLANTDALTGATSRRQYLKLLAQELARSNRHGMQLCVLSLDLDHFKRVNDTYGHAAGDAVLRHFAQVVRTQLRQSDVLGRLGGEEFSVLLSQTTPQGGLQMAQRLQAAVAGSMVVFEGEPIAVTVSIGGVHWSVGQAVAVDHLLAAADEALYRAKREGRNRVVWYGDPDPASDEPS
ncbi:MAG: GGDEF domain-containing protein [Burkholderiales bacterium]|nr:GGDEF domain-containing protein [Burkholderiales bacterium]